MRKVGDVDSRGKKRVQTVNKLPSMTVQSDAHLADIQNIMKQFGAGGIEMLDETALMFADISEFTDLQDAMNQAKRAEAQFLTLPSKVREVFNHDVAVWLDTAHDKDKRDELVEKGFLKVVEKVVEPVGNKGGSEKSTTESPDPARTAGTERQEREVKGD